MSTPPWNPLAPREQPVGDGATDVARRLKIAIFSFSTAQFDSRSLRIARSAVEAGHEVTIYARWIRGLPQEESVDGYRIVRQVSPLALLLPWGRRKRLRRRERITESGEANAKSARPGKGRGKAGGTGKGGKGKGKGRASGAGRTMAGPVRGLRRYPLARIVLGPVARIARRGRRVVRRGTRRLLKPVKPFPLVPMAWSIALTDVIEPADIWHGMWGSSLPALQRAKAQHGGRTIYDCRDILMRSRAYERMPRLLRRTLMIVERRWARQCDTVISVNDGYADIARKMFDVPRPAVVMNCPERWSPPTPRPNHFRETLGIAATTDILLYQGGLKSDRGIEQCLEAILEIPNACFVLLGFGVDREHYRDMAATERYRGKLYVVDAVPPQQLLEWSASADVMAMTYLDSSLNHQFTTPQKLFEAMSAGIPVVASDLPGFASVVRETGCGELCDPASPASIAAALRKILHADPAVRAAYGQRALKAAHDTYNWQAQLDVLSGVYARLLS